MKKSCETVLFLAWIYCNILTTVDAVNFINEVPGTTVVLKYNYTATTVDWTGPNHENKGFLFEEKDMYGIKRTWNVTTYTSNGYLNPKLPHEKRLQIVGFEKGQFYLQIKNISFYDAGLYRCAIIRNSSLIMETFIIQIKQLIELDITYEPLVPLKEGNSLHLCCHSNSIVLNQTLRWFNKQRGLQEPHMSSEACLYFKNLSRNNSGNYTCIAEYEGEIGTKDITLSVSYIPSVTFEFLNYTEMDHNRYIQCNANGYPRNYTYKQWEHKSFFDEHIRFLSGNATGYLRLPTQTRQFRYQDNGVYVCSVSNGDNSGQLFQKSQAYLISKGTPVFVNDNEKVRYGKVGQQLDVKLNAMSLSNISCQHIESKDSAPMTSVKLNRVNISAYVYGKNIKVMGWEVVFRFFDLCPYNLKEYVITVCNEFGNSSITLELLQEVKYSPEENVLSLQGIVIVVLLIIIVVLLAVMGVCFWYVRQRYRKRVITTIKNQTIGRIGEESAHYIEILEDNNTMNTLHENSNPTISAEARIVGENRNIALVSEEHHSEILNNDSYSSTGSSDKDSNHSGHFDDGYEKPYTTLVTNFCEDDTHVYFIAKKSPINDNLNTFQNPTCRDSFKVQDSLPNQTKTKLYANGGQENLEMKCVENGVNETGNEFHRPNVHLQEKKSEYINLLLKQ